MKYRQKNDHRIDAPLISTKVYLTIFLMLLVLITGQAFLLEAFIDNGFTLVGIFLWYIGVCGLLISLTLGIARKYIYGRPVQIISNAAREITNGDFSVRIDPIRKDGRKDEIEVLIEDFNIMASELQSTELFKNDFISNVTHEIKTPLSTIQSYTKRMATPYLTEEEKLENIKVILGATKNLSDMVTNMLKINKIENQGITPVVTPFQLGEQLRNCALSFSGEWDIKGIDFYINVIDIEVKLDASLLEIVWNNLISNAIKFTDANGNIELTSYRDRSHVYVMITDSGCGIAEEDSKKVFDKFYQVDSARSIEGNGLGLTLVKKILDMFGCKISIESKLDEGTTFIVKLLI